MCENCNAAKQARWGCAGEENGQPPEHPVIFDGEPIMRCPRRPILEDGESVAKVLWSWQDRDRGFLPEPGSTGDQPAKLLQAWRVVDNTVSKTRRAQEERRSARAGQGRPSGRR